MKKYIIFECTTNGLKARCFIEAVNEEAAYHHYKFYARAALLSVDDVMNPVVIYAADSLPTFTA